MADYEIIKMGALYLGSRELRTPMGAQFSNQDIPTYIPETKILLCDAKTAPPINWIHPEGMDLLIADRVLLKNLFWSTLSQNGLISGTIVVLNGLYFRCRSPQIVQRKPVAVNGQSAFKTLGQKWTLFGIGKQHVRLGGTFFLLLI